MSLPVGLIEVVLVLSGALALGLWELYSLRRDRRRSEEASKRDVTGGDS